LLKAASASRDQSYFLFATTREQLNFLRFPLGSLAKNETRILAQGMGLPVAAKPDSQDICFVPDGDYAAAIRKLRPDSCQEGEVVHADGRILGRHEGIAHFTVGQRKGLGIAVGEPLFVIRIDAGARRVVVGPRGMLETRQIRLRDVNWIGSGTFEAAARQGIEVFVKVRSTHEARPARLLGCENSPGVELASPEFGVAAGQACVFYNSGGPEARVLGGGFIAA